VIGAHAGGEAGLFGAANKAQQRAWGPLLVRSVKGDLHAKLASRNAIS
jgi:hypothetical protein